MRVLAVALLLASSLHAQPAGKTWEEIVAFEKRNAIRPDGERVRHAAKSPETLWALLIGEETTYDDRMHAATLASKVLPPRYIPILAAMREEVNSRAPWNLKVADNTIEGWRLMPWEWQMDRALRKIRIEVGATRAMDVVRDLPCTNEREERVLIDAFWEFPKTPETFGIVRNVALRRGERVHAFWYSDQVVERDHAEWGAQAFVADVAPAASLELLYGLSRQVGRMGRKGTPYTALLAVAERIDELALEPDNRRWLTDDAAALVKAVGLQADPESEVWLLEFHSWLAEHREELQKGAAAERAAIEMARARMLGVTLCR